MPLGSAIKLVRTKRRVTQESLANASGISTSYLSQLERDKKDPTFSKLQQIARALNMPLSVLIFLAEEAGTSDYFDREISEKLSYYFVNEVGPGRES